MTSRRDSFTVPVAELLRRPGTRLQVHEQLPVDGVAVVDSAVPDGTLAEVDVELEAIGAGVTATGHVRARWVGTCRRCLEPAEGVLDVAVRELYQPPDAPVLDEDAFPLLDEQVDLVPLARDALMLELPMAPVCHEGCRGLCPECGADLNAEPADHGHAPVDDRWAALGDLRFDEGDTP